MSTGTGTPTTTAAPGDEWGRLPDSSQNANDWDAAAANGGVVNPLQGLDFDTAEEGVKIGGGKIDVEAAPGSGYHLEIADAAFPTDDAGNPSLSYGGRNRIHLRLVALHSVPGQSPAGSAMWHDLEIPNPEDRDVPTKNGGSMLAALLSAICSFCVGVGVFKKAKNADGAEIIIDTATGTTKLQLATLPERLKGLQLIGRPKRRTWDPKEGKPGGFQMEFPWGNGVSQVDDPQNANVPMNEAALASIGKKRYVMPQQPANQAANKTTKQKAAPAQQQQPTAAPNAGSSAPSIDDL